MPSSTDVLIADVTSLVPALEKAERALVTDGGCRPSRAAILVQALAQAGAEEALGIAAGSEQVFSSIVDARLARLRRLFHAVGSEEPPLTRYEISVLFRITPSQAQTLITNYATRYSAEFRARLGAGLRAAAAKPKRSGKKENEIFTLTFEDPVTLDYAVDQLKRVGLVRGLVVDRPKLSLAISTKIRDAGGRDALAALRGEAP